MKIESLPVNPPRLLYKKSCPIGSHSLTAYRSLFGLPLGEKKPWDLASTVDKKITPSKGAISETVVAARSSTPPAKKADGKGSSTIDGEGKDKSHYSLSTLCPHQVVRSLEHYPPRPDCIFIDPGLAKSEPKSLSGNTSNTVSVPTRPTLGARWQQ